MSEIRKLRVECDKCDELIYNDQAQFGSVPGRSFLIVSTRPRSFNQEERTAVFETKKKYDLCGQCANKVGRQLAEDLDIKLKEGCSLQLTLVGQDLFL